MPNPLSRILLITAYCSVLITAPLVHAQTLQQAQDVLARLQTEQADISEQIKNLEAEVAARQNELAAAKTKPAPEKDELDAADKELAAAKAAHAANPNDMNETSLKNAELKHHLAERKYLKSSGNAMELQGLLQRAENQLTTLRNTLSANIGKIDAQKRAVAVAAQEASATAEAEKLKAAERKIAAEKQAAEQARNAELAAKQKAAEEQQQLADAAAAKALAEKNAAEEAAKKSAEKANGLSRLTDRAAVSQENARINALLEKFWGKGKVNQIMYLRRDGSESKSSNTLRDIGHLQYRTELLAPAGKVALNIGFRKWELEFASADAGQPFVFIYDQTDAEKPRLVYYLKSLE